MGREKFHTSYFILHTLSFKRYFLLFIFLPSLLLSITLDDAIKMAEQNNKSLMIAKKRISEADAGVIISRAGLMPKISVQGSYTRIAEPPEMEIPAPEYGWAPVYRNVYPFPDTVIGYTYGIVGADTMVFGMGQEDNYVGRASLTQPLFTWGKILDGYKIAEYNLESVKSDYKKQKNELRFMVTKSFYQILVLKELVKLTQDAYGETEKHIEVVKKRYDAGLASKFDYLRARVQLANMEPNLIKVKNGLDMAKVGFKTLLGLPQDTTIKLKGELKYEPIEVNIEESIKEALRNRPEIVSMEIRKNMAQRALTLAKKANLPNLVLIGNYDYKRPFQFKDEWGKDWNITCALQLPLFTGFEIVGKRRKALHTLKEAEYGYELLRDGIELEVRTVSYEIEEAKEVLKSSKSNIAQAEEALSIVEERYKQGLATSLEVMDTELALTKAKTNYLQALSEYLIARAKLEKAIGS